MHPDFLGALARQRDQELLRPAEFRSPARRWRTDLDARAVLKRVRSRVGEALVDVGVHLMVRT